MSLQHLLNDSTDRDVINHYLRLLALRQVELEQQVERLSRALQQRQNPPAPASAGKALPPFAPLIIGDADKPAVMTHLLNFAPAIFPGFWNQVSPGELANLIGVNKAPTIASPYPEPDLAAVEEAARNAERLSQNEQRLIRIVCYHLRQTFNLKVHRIWLSWLIQTDA